MVVVLKVQGIELRTTPSDIRRLFKDYNAHPEDIHLVLGPDGKHNGMAFLIFSDMKQGNNGFNVNGIMYRNGRITVKHSKPQEFNSFFPSMPMFSGRSRQGPKPAGRSSFGGRGGSFVASNQREQRTESKRGRSRSPIRDERSNSARELFLRNFGGNNGQSSPPRQRTNAQNGRGPKQDAFIDDRKCLHISGIPFEATEMDISDFFHPTTIREIKLLRNSAGKFAGKPNGNAILQFYSENDARQAMKLDRRKFGPRTVSITRQERNSSRGTGAMESSGRRNEPQDSVLPDTSTMNVVANAHPQVQHLLALLTATVNSLAGGTNIPPVQQPQQRSGSSRGSYRRERSDNRQHDDPVISRVANSANIEISDIREGRVVGIRNLPYSVTPNEILQFFHGFHVIADSVRIHYLEDGRCSGDAIICFQSQKDARNAVSSLNKRNIARRKVELFFL